MRVGLQQAHPPWLEAPCPFHLHCISRGGLLWDLKIIQAMQPAKQEALQSPAECGSVPCALQRDVWPSRAARWCWQHNTKG